MKAENLPEVIQGGMGAGVSNWKLARAVSRAGQLGVVAGTALDVILARRLQLGDPDGHMRLALSNFPVEGVADRILERFFIEGGKDLTEPFESLPLLDESLSRERVELIVAANFAEVYLAKRGHEGQVGINLLEKIQLPTLPSLYGAMLACVDVVLMGAGLPREIPGILDDLAEANPVRLSLDVREGTRPKSNHVEFDPSDFAGGRAPQLERPNFYAIVSSVTVANVMALKSTGQVDGLIIEGPTAGGHNAPPRGLLQLNEDGEAVYGERDVTDLTLIAKLGLPFWVAGSHASPALLEKAKSAGATGVQIGTAFAFCAESGITPALKSRALNRIRSGRERVRTDHLASPTGYPFKVFELANTMSQSEVYESRQKTCDLGYLRTAYEKPNGKLGWRCPGEPEASYLRKGGKPENIEGKKCICNSLLANIGLAQIQKSGQVEEPMLTSGSDTSIVADLVLRFGFAYTAENVLEYMLGPEEDLGEAEAQREENGVDQLA